MDLKKQTVMLEAGTILPLMEAFYTIQGEGYHKGGAAYFIRVGGCDVGCHWCDVKESWNSKLHPPTLADEIIKTAKKHSDTIVVTGGEPLMWNMDPLTEGMKSKGMKVHIETSGAYPLSGQWDWFCLSPKKNKPPTSASYGRADELKMIIHNRDDFRFAEQQAQKVAPNCKLYLQPEWSKREKMMPLIVDYVMKNTQWKVSLQTHKYLNIP
jgi:7-carboxy-7-deazaguanine synthase